MNSHGFGSNQNWSRIGQSVGFGAAGGVLGWILSETLIDLDGSMFSSLNEMRVQTGYWFALIVLGIGAAIVGGAALMNRTPPATETILIGLAAFLIGGFVSGYIAQLVYESMVDMESVDSVSDVRIPRAIGWLIAGGLGGTAVGVAFRSVKRIQNGVMGGAAGGLIGGLLFDSFGTASTARMIGITLVGALMGGLIGLIENARTSVWLSVVTGELRGRQFPVVDDVTSVGRSRSNRICLPGDSGIAEKHLDIRLEQSGAAFSCVVGQVGHNGVAATSGRLSHGDSLVIGRTEVRVELRKEMNTPVSSVSIQNAPSPAFDSGLSAPPPPPRPIPQPAPSTAPRPVIPVQRHD